MVTKGGVKNNPTASVFIAKQSPVMISLLINPQDITRFSNLVSNKKERKKVKEDIIKIRDNLLTKTKFKYNKNLEAWLGNEVTFAVTSLDFDHNSNNGTKPGYLLVVKNKNPNLAKEFLELTYSENGISSETELIFDNYKGVNLIYQRPLRENEKISTVATAVINDFVLFANDIQVLKEAINNAQAISLNLANYQPYLKAVNNLISPKISLVYLNLPSFSAWLGNKNKIDNQFIEQTLTFSTNANSHGLITDAALWGVEGIEDKTPNLFSSSTTLNYVPEESILAIASNDLEEFWQKIKTGLPENSPLKQIINQGITSLEKTLNINLEKDIFNNIKNEYAISLISTEEKKKLNWVLVAKDEEKELINNLDNVAKKQELTINKLNLVDQNITAWTKLITTSKNDVTSLETQVKGVHTKVDEYEIVTNSIDILTNSINQNKTSLLESKKFQEAIESLPKENDGYLYLNWQEIEPIINSKFPIIKVAELSFKPLFDNLKSVTIASEGNKDNVIKSSIFVRF